jgi:DNA-binding beta-propeller fold protein YncE
MIGRHPALLTVLLLLACLPSAAAQGIAVLVGSADGRAGRKPDAGQVNEPFAVAFDGSGRLHGVEFMRGNRLFRLPSAGATPEFLAGTFHVTDTKQPPFPAAAGPAGGQRFHGLHDLAIGTDGTVYLADTFNHVIRAYDPGSATVRSIAGTGTAGFGGDGGPAAAAAFNQPYCCALEPDGRGLLVCDIRNARLRRIDLAGGTVTTVAGNGTSGRPVDGAVAIESPLTGPRAACRAPDGTIYLALREGNALLAIRDGRIRTAVNAAGKAGFGGDDGPANAALLAGPKYVSLDRAGRVLIVDTENHCVRRYDPATGTITTVAGMPTKAGTALGADWRSTHLDRPHGAAIDPDGRLVVVDSENDRILVGAID